jgi:ADP-heptose:LPS heptosyltransferase
MKRILVIRIDFLGDMVCTTAFLHALKRQWPQADIHVLASKYNRAVLERNPDVTAVHTYVYSKQCERNDRPGRLAAMMDRARLLIRLRRFAFDLVVVPNGGMHKNSVRFARQLGAKACRWHDVESEFDDRKPEHAAKRPMRHEALSGFALMPELAPATAESLRLRLFPEPALMATWESALSPKLRPRVGFFVSNKAESRRWDVRKWRQLADVLVANADVIIIRDPGDACVVESSLPSAARVISPPTVPDLIAATSVLDLVVSADSSPVHIASALGLPVVALFEDRPEKCLRWHPLGVPNVMLRAGPKVDDISVAQVADATRSLLEEHVLSSCA